MIFLNPPFRVAGGYAVLPDHADPGLFYAIPPSPRVARAPGGGPALSMIQYLGGGAGAAKIQGGLLTLTTELVVADEALAALRRRVAGSAGDAGSIRVEPVLFDEGSVELVALGAASGTPAAPAPETTTDRGDAPAAAPAAPARAGPFAIQFLGAGRPSLGGANTATFQLVLDAPAAELIERALDAPSLPVLVIYRMAFAGLRPSFEIRVEADWRKAYHSLSNKAKLNLWYVAADAETMVSSALEETGVRIDTKVLGTGPGAQQAAERARKQLVDWVLQHLFTPMADPAADAAGIGRVIDDTVWSLVRSVVPGVGYRLREVDDEQLRFLSAQMDEAVAERREVIPQGSLGAFLQPYRVDAQGRDDPAWPAIRSGLVQKVNLSGFPRLEVKVAVEDRFGSDGLREAQVEIGRPGADASLRDAATFAFRSAGDRHDYVVNLLGEPEASFRAPYRHRVRAAFDPASPFGPHDPVVSEWQSGNTTELYVEPRWAYAIRQVQASAAPTFSFAQFPAVSVELEYAAEGEASRQVGRLRLSEEHPEGTWRFRSFAPTALPYSYRVTYHRAGGGGDIEGPWCQQIADWLSVPDPLPTKRTLNLFVNLPWPEIAMAYVQLRYADDANGIRYDEQIDLGPAARYVRRDYPIAAEGPRTIAYRLTMLLQAGGLLEGSWRETDDDRLILDRRLVERRIVTVRAVGSLSESKLAEVRVSLQVRDPATDQVRAETELRLTPNGAAPPPWEYLLGDPPARAVRAGAVFVDTNGFVQRTPQQTTDADLIVVDLRNKTIRA